MPPSTTRNNQKDHDAPVFNLGSSQISVKFVPSP